jgi:phage terminase large subunit-like protein
VGEEGTGWIPKEELIDWKKRQAGVSDVVDAIRVKHKSGGVSVINLKVYEQQRKEWQGRSLDFVWFDEEPPMDIYTEGLTRILDRKGCILMTFTPLKGPTEVVRHFINPEEGASVYVKNVGWDDAPHLDEKAKAELLASFPVHERDARSAGTPLLGSGAIFPIRDADLMVDPFEIPSWYARINGIDFGIDHPGACVWCAWDRDNDTFYVYDCYKRSGETPVYHAAAIKKHGDWVPTAWPHDGMQRDKGSGIALKDQFRNHGVYMLRDHAHYPDERQNSREAGLIEMYEYMRTGRFKVFSTLSDWFEEKRLYHRDDGKVVDKYDDIMAATRYGFVMRRFAKTRPFKTVNKQRPSRPIVGGRQWRA